MNIQLDADYIISCQVNEEYKLGVKDEPPKIALATTRNYELLSKFNFSALIEFVKAHQGGWCKLENISQTNKLQCKPYVRLRTSAKP
jgi:hypothetical protein